MNYDNTNHSGPVAGIRLVELEKSYRTPTGPVRAVRNIDVTIAAGETVALLGPNGAGKSTTIDMVLGLLKPDSGSVSIFGDAPAAAIKSGKVGAMLQAGAVLRDLTVRELITMMASLFPAPMEIDRVLDLASIGDIAHRRTEKLSGGQTQRVRFGVALVSDPDVLVLDEPTVGMDVGSRHAFWMTVRDFAALGKTVIFATHYLEEADLYADRAILVAAGNVIADGPPTEIKAMVGLRTIRATLPDVATETLAEVPGVTAVERRGESVVLTCSDSDLAIRELLERFEDARDIEISGAGLEEAFLHLTADPADAETEEARK
jgi:ABC-2 type transport system ATP-binding protein